MFNSYEIEYKKAQEDITTLKKENRELKADHERDIARTKESHGDELARVMANVDTKITEATNKLTKEVSTLESDKKIALEKVAMYEKAFENLGFDVKDMKDILNKLVDGLVSKNQIQLIGSGTK